MTRAPSRTFRVGAFFEERRLETAKKSDSLGRDAVHGAHMERNVVVVGGTNLDICGKSDKPVVAHDSNLGT
jgi:hypothetical protein